LTVDGGRCSDNTFRIVGSNHEKEVKRDVRGRIPLATFMDEKRLWAGTIFFLGKNTKNPMNT
jgi:type IV secretory pathway protease TraF